MPPFQTSTATKPLSGYPGMMADASEWNGVSGFINEAAAEPGFPVQHGASDRTFNIFTTGAFAGILRAHITAAPKGVFTQNAMVAAADEGHIWVKAGGACTRGTKVYWNATTKGYQSASAGGVLIPGAEFLGTGVLNAVVRVNLRKLPGGFPA